MTELQAATERAVMTVGEVARELGISRGRAYDYLQRGLIPHLRLGGRILIPRAQYDRWLQGEAQPADSVPTA